MDTLETMSRPRQITTRKGVIQFPTYVPVTTFGKKYPLDDLVRPYLPRLAQAVMVSYHYAKQQDRPLRLPMFVDSGGFASLFERAIVEEHFGLGVIRLPRANEDGFDEICAQDVLEFQEKTADVAFTLDFPIPPGRALSEAIQRQDLTIKNAIWAIKNRRRKDLLLYACVQGWDEPSYLACAKSYVDYPFDGIAIGGLVPRIKDTALVENVIREIRAIFPSTPIHVFGLGQPNLVKRLFTAGADSVDSSAYVKLAADGRLWGQKTSQAGLIGPTERMQIALLNLANANNRTLPLSTAKNVFGRS